MQVEVAANSKQQSEDAEAAIAAARSDETEAREQVQLMRKQLLEVQEQQCRSRSSAHVQTDETIGTRVQDELRTALVRVAELERDATRAARKVPGPMPTRDAAFAPAETDHSSESVDAAFSSQRGAIVDGICATCGADVPVRFAAFIKFYGSRAASNVPVINCRPGPSAGEVEGGTPCRYCSKKAQPITTYRHKHGQVSDPCWRAQLRLPCILLTTSSECWVDIAVVRCGRHALH